MKEFSKTRRQFLIAGVAVGAAGAVSRMAYPRNEAEGAVASPGQTIQGVMPWRDGTADVPSAESGTDYRYFNAAEQAFVTAAVDRMIPADPTGPSGSEAGVPLFLDRQMAGSYGRGDHFFLGGPWPKGTPEQGYQSRMPPAQVYRTSITAIDKQLQAQYGKPFAQLSPEQQDDTLKSLEKGELKLEDADGKAFFILLLQNVLEGYFSDPIYGGNKDMAAWKMIGFPGAHYNYRDWVKRHGDEVPLPPTSIRGRSDWSSGSST